VGDFPIGIAPDDFKDSIVSETTQGMIKQLYHAFHGTKIILGVDRLDYTKGIPQKLRAFDKFLTDHPEWTEKAVLVQLAIPTRSEVEEYKVYREQVEQMVGMINGKHGMSSCPVLY
jgi:trehalose 6-phosphate synthase